mmetsp:Transcript_17371/g.35966  ORF Transcript_17371/g.35966 Transcript_17371/m.35966 type:complete len:902 (+) Transcript_17371:196-2901(+)|eukprot:CAMPEP_0168165514 /NCGR_PEP_ID=MMETSP0139_2-20121125/1529_1 /TAXON_ID=44445 /ORGANISM="Pseudo-nitzschia australis, Strain 10249 10 AB" /LENGTH=901 /DNA_ID=CAMNT_0008082639 /DNA_START=61 /DNA_END=2766 /DNA_ORIENTATION=-
MADTQQQQQQRQQHHHQSVEGDSHSSDPTPVPNSFRPPPPTYRSSTPAMAMESPSARAEDHDRYQTSLLNSTMLSLSVDDMGTLPSLALEPPSPMSRSSESTTGEWKHSSAAGTPANAKKETAHTTTLSLARARRKQQREQNNAFLSANTSGSHGIQKNKNNNSNSNNAEKKPPIRELYMDDDQTDQTDGGANNYNHDYVSTEGGESDTFYEYIEDRSLANRARRSLRSDVHSSSHRSLLSSPDVQPQQTQQHNGTGSSRRRGGLENIHENIGSDDVVRVHESALHALQQLKEELVKSNQRNEELTREQENWKRAEQNFRQQLTTLQTTDLQKTTDLERLRQDHERLKIDKEATEKQRDQFVEEKRTMEKQTRESARTIKELRHRTLAGDNRHKGLKGQLDKLNDELEDSLSAKGEMAAELARAQTERMELETEKEKLRKELSEVMHERDRTTSDGNRIEDDLRNERRKLQELRTSRDTEIGRLNGSLRKANEALHRLRAELTPKVRSAVRNITNPSSQARGGVPITGTSTYGGIKHAPNTTTTSSLAESAVGPPHTLDTAIADRLARLRDSAERANLIRGHKRELARLKTDRDATIQKLETDHADALKKAARQFDDKRKSDLEELAEKLNRQYESRLQDVEEEHRKRLSQLQKDYGRSQEESDESLEEALTRIARVSHDHEREKGRRHALERTVEDLHRKMKVQQKDLQAKHVGELEKRRHQWESQKDTLLGNLQRDCNVAFENQRRNANGNIKWAGTPTGVPATAVQGNYLHIDTTESSRAMPSQGQSHHPLHHSSQQHQQTNGHSPLSMNSEIFFTENKKNTANAFPAGQAAANHGTNNMGGTTYIVPSRNHHGDSPSPIAMVSRVGSTDGSPTIVSRSYSDIDSVLRETEELVQSIL